jgi:hypothetical protein
MPRTDIPSSVQQAGSSVLDSAHDLAATKAEAVREQAASVGQSVSSAVSSAVEVAAKRGQKAQKKAQKKIQKKATQTQKTLRKQAARVRPEQKGSKGKKFLGLALIVAVGAGVAGVLKKKQAQPETPTSPTAVR